ncbi:hypothetical protein AUP68_09185 [Ilyonectria robusta]
MSEDMNHCRPNAEGKYIHENKALKIRCRKRLAAHIKVAHLFSKNLSDHGIAAYKELYDGVGQSFHTVSFIGTKNGLGNSPSLTLKGLPGSIFGVGSIWNTPINQKSKETTECEHLQRDLEMTRDKCERLAQQLEERSEKATTTETLLYKCLEVFNQAASLIEQVQQECIDSMEFTAFTD